MKKYLAEGIGTFGLVFFGTGAIIINSQSNGLIGHPGIALAFGLIVMVMIYAFGETSGAHLNPAVSIGFALAKRFKSALLPGYIISQIAGAVTASIFLKFLFPSDQLLGSTLPHGSEMQSFIFETILSYFLMLVILNVSQGSKEIGILAGIAVGGTVGLEALIGGPICGASMNPARSLAPALVSGNLNSLWIYIAAPILGSCLGSLTWKGMNK